MQFQRSIRYQYMAFGTYAAHTQTHTQMHTHTQTHTHPHTYRHTCTHIDTHTDTCTHTCTHRDTHAHTERHTQTHMHTETHTCKQDKSPVLLLFAVSITVGYPLSWSDVELYKAQDTSVLLVRETRQGV